MNLKYTLVRSKNDCSTLVKNSELSPVALSIYIWSKNFSYSACEK